MRLLIKEELTDEEITKFFLEDPRLCWMALPDNELHELYHNKVYKKGDNSKYFGLTAEDELFAVIKYEMFSQLALCVHPYMSSKHQGKGHIFNFRDVIGNYLIKTTGFKKFIFSVPEPCKHVVRTMEKYGAKLEGQIKNIIIWRQQPVDLLYYRLELEEVEIDG